VQDQYKRAARLRQAILRRVENHQRDWWYGMDPRVTKLWAEIDDLIVEHIQEEHEDRF
jgi:hypothetical protein